MTTGLVTVKSDDGIAAVAQLMSERGIRRVLVTHRGEVIGVITERIVLARLKDYVDNVSSQISRLQAPWF
jgi:CBS domain-containing protein